MVSVDMSFDSRRVVYFESRLLNCPAARAETPDRRRTFLLLRTERFGGKFRRRAKGLDADSSAVIKGIARTGSRIANTRDATDIVGVTNCMRCAGRCDAVIGRIVVSLLRDFRILFRWSRWRDAEGGSCILMGDSGVNRG